VADRREFIGSVVGSLLSAPFAAIAQSSVRVPRIGVLANYEARRGTAFVAACASSVTSKGAPS
jgi:hypothetical protein